MPAVSELSFYQHRHSSEQKFHNFREKLCIQIAHAYYKSTESILKEVIKSSEPTVISDFSQQTSN